MNKYSCYLTRFSISMDLVVMWAYTHNRLLLVVSMIHAIHSQINLHSHYQQLLEQFRTGRSWMVGKHVQRANVHQLRMSCNWAFWMFNDERYCHWSVRHSTSTLEYFFKIVIQHAVLFFFCICRLLLSFLPTIDGKLSRKSRDSRQVSLCEKCVKCSGEGFLNIEAIYGWLSIPIVLHTMNQFH